MPGGYLLLRWRPCLSARLNAARKRRQTTKNDVTKTRKQDCWKAVDRASARASTNYFKVIVQQQHFLEKLIAISIDCNFTRNRVIRPYNGSTKEKSPGNKGNKRAKGNAMVLVEDSRTRLFVIINEEKMDRVERIESS